ncbi:DUF618 domain-containing protein [Plectosphaerella cucumerina]|uniref:DUF618 domain-containing protein n=1 Tax=Plectosphaerella cucumerina TaxID=40658 RepID=A0A8K0TE37_9PEZI|nr:DUF618 domain-containing protein [Plectosphaerella cucumerina]
MAFSDDSVLARLSSLNESHDSIATAAQWIMFHRRHADRTAQIWLQRLRESSSTKRLSLVYLANEVTQQSKARNRPDFVLAFAPVIAEALAIAYKGAPADIQGKLRRVVEVWADRNIFEPPIQAAIESRLQDADRSKGTPKSGGFGTAAHTIHPDLSTLIHLQQNVARHNLPVKAAVGTANQDWDKVQDPSVPIPSAPVYAARLNGLLRSLAAAEGAVADSVKARSELLRELQRLVENASQGLAEDTQTLSVLSKRKAETEDKRREVEHAIMRTLPGQEAAGDIKDGASNSPAPEPERPEVEELTPPPDNMVSRNETDVPRSPPPQETTLPARVPEPEQHAASGIEMLSNLASQYQSLPVSTNGSNKRRRVNSDEFPDLGADDGIDADVAEMLRRDGDAG